jgi:hypothetical protein
MPPEKLAYLKNDLRSIDLPLISDKETPEPIRTQFPKLINSGILQISLENFEECHRSKKCAELYIKEWD